MPPQSLAPHTLSRTPLPEWGEQLATWRSQENRFSMAFLLQPFLYRAPPCPFPLNPQPALPGLEFPILEGK